MSFRSTASEAGQTPPMYVIEEATLFGLRPLTSSRLFWMTDFDFSLNVRANRAIFRSRNLSATGSRLSGGQMVNFFDYVCPVLFGVAIDS